MKQIDKLVLHLFRFGAHALVVTSNAPVVARVASGDRTSNQVLDHAAVVTMVREIAPPEALQEILLNRASRFPYEGGSNPVTVEVTPSASAWKVVLSPVAPAPRVSPASPVPAAPARLAPAPPVAPTASAEAVARARLPVRPGAAAALGAAAAALGAAPASGGAIALGAAAAALGAPGATPGATPRTPPGDTTRIDRMLRAMTQSGASDLHLSTGCPPLVRLHGEILRMEDAPAFTDESLRAVVWPVVPARNREEFERRHDTDFAYELAGLARFRANVFMDRNGLGAVLRRIPYEILAPEKLGLTPEMLDLCNLTKGLVLVTGPTGSGKSTTLATLVDRINNTRDDHIITIEDPIEFVHHDKRCLVNQREVRVHTDSFRAALRAALRQDPDIVLVGEMRDLETIEIAIETAETGHLVFGTLHTTTAPSTVDRIIDQFPADRQAQIRTMLAESLKGVIAQTLCKKIGGGRIAAYEVLIGTTAVANLIREGKTFQLYGTMQSGRSVGMVTLGDALMDLLSRGLIDVQEAYMKAINKSEMRNLLLNAGFNPPEL